MKTDKEIMVMRPTRLYRTLQPDVKLSVAMRRKNGTGEELALCCEGFGIGLEAVKLVGDDWEVKAGERVEIGVEEQLAEAVVSGYKATNILLYLGRKVV